MLKFEENKPLAPLTSLGIGGSARLFLRAETEDEVAGAVRYAEREDLRLFVLGGGSNVLISDRGFDGLVIQIGVRGEASEEMAGLARLVTVGAGVDWDEFVARCVGDRLAGLECLSGIPGLVGGTPVQNVGAYGQEVSDTITQVRCFDRTTGKFLTLSKEDCEFSYRRSIFNTSERDRFIVLSVTFSLISNGPATLRYPEVAAALDDSTADLTNVRAVVLQLRRRKSMVIDPSDSNSRSAGSFFKNPVVDGGKLCEIQAQFNEVPFFRLGDSFKIPAAWLIEKAGFPKGFSLGAVGISWNHNLAIINRGGAAATDVLRLKELIQQAVTRRFQIDLEPEPVFVGFETAS